MVILLKKRMRALFSKNPSRCLGWELQQHHWGCSIQSRCLSTINPVAVVASFEVCAVGSGIQGGSSRRFKGGFGRHQARVSSMVAISSMMILGGEIAIGRGSLQRAVSSMGWWHAHVVADEQFRPPDSLGWSVPFSTKVRPPDMSVGVSIS